MVSIAQVLAYGVAALVVIAIPGPSVLFVIGRALAHGRRTALLSVVGNALGLEVVAVLVALGVGTVVQRSYPLFLAVKLAGAAYLVWLGIKAIRQRRSLPSAMAGSRVTPGDWRALREGLVVTVMNPKSFILTAAILPQFVHRAAGHVPEQMLLLSVVSFLIVLVSDSCWGLAASTVRSWFARSPRRLELVGSTGGLAMIALGIGIAVTGRST